MSDGPGPSFANRIQRRLEGLYRLAPLPAVDDFIGAPNGEEREHVLVREHGDDVEVAVILPEEARAPSLRELSLDVVCQIVEGVSHFVYLAERVRAGRPTTQLELELQAEVDKFALLGLSAVERGDVGQARRLHAKLYGAVRFIHEGDTEQGVRYRIANDLAARFCARLRASGASLARARLRRFFDEGQEQKIRLARAA